MTAAFPFPVGTTFSASCGRWFPSLRGMRKRVVGAGERWVVVAPIDGVESSYAFGQAASRSELQEALGEYVLVLGTYDTPVEEVYQAADELSVSNSPRQSLESDLQAVMAAIIAAPVPSVDNYSRSRMEAENNLHLLMQQFDSDARPPTTPEAAYDPAADLERLRQAAAAAEQLEQERANAILRRRQERDGRIAQQRREREERRRRREERRRREQQEEAERRRAREEAERERIERQNTVPAAERDPMNRKIKL